MREPAPGRWPPAVAHPSSRRDSDRDVSVHPSWVGRQWSPNERGARTTTVHQRWLTYCERKSTACLRCGGWFGLIGSRSWPWRTPPPPLRSCVSGPETIRISRKRVNFIRNWPDCGTRSDTNSGVNSSRGGGRSPSIGCGHDCAAVMVADSSSGRLQHPFGTFTRHERYRADGRDRNGASRTESDSASSGN